MVWCGLFCERVSLTSVMANDYGGAVDATELQSSPVWATRSELIKDGCSKVSCMKLVSAAVIVAALIQYINAWMQHAVSWNGTRQQPAAYKQSWLMKNYKQVDLNFKFFSHLVNPVSNMFHTLKLGPDMVSHCTCGLHSTLDLRREWLRNRTMYVVKLRCFEIWYPLMAELSLGLDRHNFFAEIWKISSKFALPAGTVSSETLPKSLSWTFIGKAYVATANHYNLLIHLNCVCELWICVGPLSRHAVRISGYMTIRLTSTRARFAISARCLRTAQQHHRNQTYIQMLELHTQT